MVEGLEGTRTTTVAMSSKEGMVSNVVRDEGFCEVQGGPRERRGSIQDSRGTTGIDEDGDNEVGGDIIRDAKGGVVC
jgi:hypothetical protein